MKIAFIPACLEPGKDGVGDYTALLAGECARRGHGTLLLSVNDPYVVQPMVQDGSLRLPSRLPWGARVEMAGEFLAAFRPDFVSLQFVCYGLQPRGIDFAMARRMRAIIERTRVHIMFHELWIGMEEDAAFKDRFTGMLQRACVLNMIKNLNIRVAHTSNETYAELLRVHGVDAPVLPLFGSIPVSLQMPPSRPLNGTLAFGLFGTLHPVWPPEPLLSRLPGLGRKIVIKHIGRMGAGENLWNRIARDYDGMIEFQKFGEQPPEKIAKFLREEIDFGISTTPWSLIGKSATVAAMLEHGLPVIVNRDDWHAAIKLKAGPASPLLIKMGDDLPERISGAERGKPAPLLPIIAGRFLGDLESAP